MRDRLGARDRAYLAALLGPDFPRLSPFGDIVAAHEEAARLNADRPEVWFKFGDFLYHYGALAGLPNAPARARSAFERAVALDSSLAPPLEHLVHLTARTGDTAGVRRFMRAYLARGPAADIADAVRWRAALALGDSATVRATRARFARMGAPILLRIAGTAMNDGVGTDDGETAHRLALARDSAAPTPSALLAFGAMVHAFNAGQPERALAYAETWATDAPFPAPAFLRVVGATDWDADSGRARRVVEASSALLGRAPASAREYHRTIGIACAVADWQARRGARAAAGGYIERLRSFAAAPPAGVRAADVTGCATIAEAGLAIRDGRGVDEHVRRVDSLVISWNQSGFTMARLNLTLARLHEFRGDPLAALAATRRRAVQYEPGFNLLLSTQLREEGRLALAVGDTAGAVRAYRHYLALRPDPEPSLRADVARVRAELTRLGVAGAAPTGPVALTRP
jgi:tetratricopeptide (TPR) repeat protein